MENDTEYTERAYTTSEVATMLDIAVPTVRKYAQSLEHSGYVFIRGKGKGKHQARLFVEKDITALRYLKQLRDKSNITVQQATDIVISKFGKGAIQTVATTDTPTESKHDKQYNELKELIHKQTEVIRELSKRIDHQQEYIDKRLNERDQVLLQTLNESLETQKQLAATTEKQGFFSKLFNK